MAISSILEMRWNKAVQSAFLQIHMFYRKSDWLKCIVLVCLMGLPVQASPPSGSGPADQGEPLKIGSRKQLFVDDFLVAERMGVNRELGRVVKANGGKPVMVPDKPWEDDAFGCPASVMHD